MAASGRKAAFAITRGLRLSVAMPRWGEQRIESLLGLLEPELVKVSLARGSAGKLPRRHLEPGEPVVHVGFRLWSPVRSSVLLSSIWSSVHSDPLAGDVPSVVSPERTASLLH